MGGGNVPRLLARGAVPLGAEALCRRAVSSAGGGVHGRRACVSSERAAAVHVGDAEGRVTGLEAVLAAPALGGAVTLVTAALKFLEQRSGLAQRRIRERVEYLERLRTELRQVTPVFSGIIDYEGTHDAALRVDDLLTLTPEEISTRGEIDRAMEHLRNVRDAVRLGLIEHEDLGAWVYWIHRSTTYRPIVSKYVHACGYGAFLDDLKLWTAESPELNELRTHCTWMKEDRP